MQERFGTDLSAVRLHEGSGASAAARDINARAFTSGTHVVLGQDVEIHSDSGRLLLQHELTHVIQQSRGQHPARWIDGGPGDPLERAADQPERNELPPTAGPEVGTNSNTAGTTVQRQERRAAGGPEVFAHGPCEIDVGQLTNSELLLQLNRARAFIVTHDPCEGECYDYANLFRRLSAERYRRVELGHLWLAQSGLLTIPDTLYLVSVSDPEHLRVSEINGSYADTNTPSGAILLGVEQFRAFFEENGFPVIDLHDQPGTFIDPLTGGFGHADWTSVLSTKPADVAGADLASRIFWFGPSSAANADATATQLGSVPTFRGGVPTFLGGVPRAQLGWPADASAGPFPWALSSDTRFGDESNPSITGDQSGDVAPTTPSALALQGLRDSPGRYTLGGAERVYFAPEKLGVPGVAPFPFNPLLGPQEEEDPWDPAYMGASSIAPLGRPSVLPEGATGVMWEGAHTSDVLSLHGRMVARGFRAGYGRHLASDLERMSGYGFGNRMTSSLNVGTPGSYANDALFPLGGETLHRFGAPGHWSGQGAVVVYRADGTPATAAQILELMGSAQAAMAGETYRFSPPPAGSTADAFAAAYALERGLPWPCGGGRMCINLPLDATNVADVHTAALGTPMVYTDANGNLIDLRDPHQATASRMSEYMNLPDSYFEARGLRRVRIGPSVMGGYGVAGGLGAATSVGMDIATGNYNEGTFRRAGIGAGTGITGAIAEDFASTAITTRLATSIPGAWASGLGRVGAATGVGAALAPVATGLEMYFDDRRYTSIDYAARMGRSTVTAVAGAGGGALAVIGVSTMAGSEVPILGNAVGFVVGLAIVIFTDWAVGDEIEEGIRVNLGERGCSGTRYEDD